MDEGSKINVELKIDNENEEYKKLRDFDDNDYSKFLINISDIKQKENIKEKKNLCKNKYDIITADSISTTTDEISNTYQVENKADEKEKFLIHEKNDYSIANSTDENINKMEDVTKQKNECVSVYNIIYSNNTQELNSYENNNIDDNNNNNNHIYSDENHSIPNFINQENEINRKSDNHDNLVSLKKKLNNLNSKNEYNENYYRINMDSHNKKNANCIESTYESENCINHNIYSNNINAKNISNTINCMNKNNNHITYNLNNSNLNNSHKGFNANIHINNESVNNSNVSDNNLNIINYVHENNKNRNDIFYVKNNRNMDKFSHITNNEHNIIRRINNKTETMNNNIKNINNINSINSINKINNTNSINNINNINIISSIKNMNSMNNLKNLNNFRDLTNIYDLNNSNHINNNMYYLNMKYNINLESSKMINNTNLLKETLEASHNNFKNSQFMHDNVSCINKNGDKSSFLKNNSIDKRNLDLKDFMTCVKQMNNANGINKNNNNSNNNYRNTDNSNSIISNINNSNTNISNINNGNINISNSIISHINSSNTNVSNTNASNTNVSNTNHSNNNSNHMVIKKISKKRKELCSNYYKKMNDENYKIIKNIIQNKNIINYKYINSIPKYDLRKECTQNNKCTEKEYRDLLHLESNTEIQKVLNNKKKIILTVFELKIFLLNTIKAIGIVLKKWKLKKFGLYFWFHIKSIENEIDLSFYINIFNFLFEIITGKSIYYQSNDINIMVTLFKEFIIYDCKNVFKKTIKILNRYAKKNSKEFSIFKNNEDIIKLNQSLLFNEDELNTKNKKNNFYNFLFNAMKETSDFFEKNGQGNNYLYNIFSNFNELNYNEIFNFYLFSNNELSKTYNSHKDYS